MLQITKYLLEKIAATSEDDTDITDNIAEETQDLQNADDINQNMGSRYTIGQRVSSKGRNMDNYDMDMAHNDLADIYNYANGQQPEIANYNSIKEGLTTEQHAAEVARINSLREQQRAHIARMQQSPEYARFQEMKEQYKNDPTGYQDALNTYWNERMQHRLKEYNQVKQNNQQNLDTLYRAQPYNYQQEAKVLNISVPKSQQTASTNTLNKIAPTNMVKPGQQGLGLNILQPIGTKINNLKTQYAKDINSANKALQHFHNYYQGNSPVNMLNQAYGTTSKDSWGDPLKWMTGARLMDVPNYFTNIEHGNKPYAQVYNEWVDKNPGHAEAIKNHPLNIKNLKLNQR